MIRIKKTLAKEEIIEAFCDICGGDCMIDMIDMMMTIDENSQIKSFEGMELKATWGYASIDKDGEIWEAVVCEKCVTKHLSPLIKFKIKNYL